MNKDVGLVKTRKVAGILTSLGAELYMDSAYEQFGGISGVCYLPHDEVFSRAQGILVLGGDGTLLRVSVAAVAHSLPLLGINLGKMGFLTEVEGDEESLFAKLVNDEYTIEPRMMIKGVLQKADGRGAEFHALNDIVVSRGAFSRIMTLRVSVDGKFMDAYNADGLIISTPTGSTAYSLSAGGPIIEPSAQAISITPICPHALRSRSVVVTAERTVTVELTGEHKGGMYVSVNGNNGGELLRGETLTVSKSPLCTNLIRINNRDFYDILHKKLYGSC